MSGTGPCCVTCNVHHITKAAADIHRKKFEIDILMHAWMPLSRRYGSEAVEIDVCSCGVVRVVRAIYASGRDRQRRRVRSSTKYYRFGKAGSLRRKPSHR